MPFTIIRNDIIKLKVDAILNAANTNLQMGGGVCGLEGDTIGGLNAMLSKQQTELGECRISTVLFDHHYEVLHDRIDIRACPHALAILTHRYRAYMSGGVRIVKQNKCSLDFLNVLVKHRSINCWEAKT